MNHQNMFVACKATQFMRIQINQNYGNPNITKRVNIGHKFDLDQTFLSFVHLFVCLIVPLDVFPFVYFFPVFHLCLSNVKYLSEAFDVIKA